MNQRDVLNYVGKRFLHNHERNCKNQTTSGCLVPKGGSVNYRIIEWDYFHLV